MKFRKGQVPWNKNKKCPPVTGVLNGMWKGGKSLSSHGYIIINDGPCRNVYEHRRLIEQAIGRALSPKEQIHHLDGNKKNNNLKNLMIVDIRTHRRLDNGWFLRDGRWYKRCPKCRKIKSLESNFYKRSDGYHFFSCKECCRQKYVSKISVH